MAKNKTFNKCSECGNKWITSKCEVFPHLSPDYYDKSTEEKPFIKKCRKCFKKEEWNKIMRCNKMKYNLKYIGSDKLLSDCECDLKKIQEINKNLNYRFEIVEVE